MAEKIISPGVFTKEIDASFLPAAIGNIGAAIVGPTVKGPSMVPTIVNSYQDFQATFGDTFRSGSNTFQYLTSVTAEHYLKHSGKLIVVRILDDSPNRASADIPVSGSVTTTAGNIASGSLTFSSSFFAESGSGDEVQITVGGSEYRFISSAPNDLPVDASPIFFVASGSSTATAIDNLVVAIDAAAIGVTAGDGATALELTSSTAGTAGNSITVETGSGGGAISTDTLTLEGGTTATSTGHSYSFKLNTHSEGSILNNSSSLGQTNNVLLSGSSDNIRWEISNKNDSKGTFGLLIRSGNDTQVRKSSVETWNNLSLDPNSNNYIGKMIGDSYASINNGDKTDPFVEYVGNFPNKSKYVYVSDVVDTPDYMDENGAVSTPAQSQSHLPGVGSGSWDGSFSGASDGYGGFDSFGNPQNNFTGSRVDLYGNIGDDNYQGYKLSSATTADGGEAYTAALNLLSNADEYDINLLLIPGITDQDNGYIVKKAIDVCEGRGDCFLIYDSVRSTEKSLANVASKAKERDSNYAATYWPWVQIGDSATGHYRWVPPSVVMAGIYAFNDKVAAPWFAPAGMNRGGLDTVIQAARKLTHGNRDDLYESNVNPIATFPGQGVVVWGQKTLQKKSSALDRVNVRRLMIKVKKFIAASSRFLVFEQNNTGTRNRFLNIVNPFLEQVQSQSGLNAFKVIMDDTNNTPDIVDRNILYGQIFLQPTRTAEFIVLDFTIQPTGAAFPE